ncbi:hypothetical protein [Streptomyces sp. NPDC002520]
MRDRSPRRTRLDLAEALTALYAVFALAATGRSGVQLATQMSRAPLAYTLSALAAVIYIGGLVTLRAADRSGRARRWALLLCGVELAGVIGVGTFSLAAPEFFPDASVWSGFGSGYGYLPLALPLCALLWLLRQPAPAVTSN